MYPRRSSVSVENAWSIAARFVCDDGAAKGCIGTTVFTMYDPVMPVQELIKASASQKFFRFNLVKKFPVLRVSTWVVNALGMETLRGLTIYLS